MGTASLGSSASASANASASASASAAVEVLRRARREAERYGDDPWVFLRELVQNARDAGAARIAISTKCLREIDREQLICEDDGAGMSPSLVEIGLLRLFSSQKTHTGAAGCFGVGFWSTLRFDPITVRCDTNDGTTATSIVVDVATGAVNEVPATRRTRGTTITLERRAREASAEAFSANVRRSTQRSSGCITGVDNRPVPIIRVDGVDVRRKMGDDLFDAGDPRARVKGDGFEGIVGFSKRPRVELMVHGLLVKEALSLDELLPSRLTKTTWAPGLWPVAAIEAPAVTVLLDRQGVVEDALVRRIVEEAEATLATLLEQVLDELVPLPWYRRLAARAVKRAPTLLLATSLLVGLGAGAFIAREIVKQRAPHVLEKIDVPWERPTTSTSTATATATSTSTAPLRPRAGPPRLIEDAVIGGGPRVDDLSSSSRSDVGWDIDVRSDEPLLFLRLSVLDRLDTELGIVASPPLGGARSSLPHSSAPARVVAAEDVVATVTLRSRGGAKEIALPHAPGTHVDDVRIDDARPRSLVVTEAGLVRAIPTPDGSDDEDDNTARIVRYRLLQGESAPRPPVPRMVRIRLPDELVAEARSLETLPARQRVEAAESFVRNRLRYATDAATRAAIDRADGGFYDRVLAVGAGDCDVVNAVLTALLVEAGVPARVGVGLVAQSDGIGTPLHAWTEAFVPSEDLGGFELVVADASPPVVLASLSRTPAPRRFPGGAGAPPATQQGGAGVPPASAFANDPSSSSSSSSSPSSPSPSSSPPSSFSSGSDRATRPLTTRRQAAETLRAMRERASLVAEVQEPRTRPPVSSAGGTPAPPGEIAPGRTREPAPSPWLVPAGTGLVVVSALALLALFARRLLRRARDQRIRDGVDLTPLFVQALRRGDRSDPLGLRHRPLLPAHDGGRLSLDEAERLASEGALSFAHADALASRHAMSLRLRRGARVLLADDPRVEAVRPHLFGIVDLDRAIGVLGLPLDERARSVEAAAREVHASVAARVVPGRGFVELALPFASPRALLLVGAEDAPTPDAALALYRRASTYAHRVDGSAR